MFPYQLKIIASYEKNKDQNKKTNKKTDKNGKTK